MSRSRRSFSTDTRSSAPSTISPTAQAVVDVASDGMRLDQFLARRFGQELDLSRRQARARIEDGSVYVGGKRVTRLSREVRQGEKVELRLAGPIRDLGWRVSQENVLFEDDDLIAINKPPGLPTQATLDTSRHNLHRAVEEYLRAKPGVRSRVESGDGYAGLHQRLDRETSGVIVLTKSRRANKGLAEQISGHLVTKIYTALTIAPTDRVLADSLSGDEGRKVENHLRKRSGKPARMEAALSGGDRAETSFRRLEAYLGAWLVRAEPRTGRMHQIRVHLADLGMPILGDSIYGGSTLRTTVSRLAPRLMLHARELHLRHPITGQEMRLEAPLPEDFLQTIARLRVEAASSRPV